MTGARRCSTLTPAGQEIFDRGLPVFRRVLAQIDDALAGGLDEHEEAVRRVRVALQGTRAPTERTILPMAKTEGRETDSGIEVKPVYTADDVAGLELELPGEFPFTRGPYRDDVPRPAVDDPPVRGLRARPRRRTQRFRYLLDRGQTGLSIAFDLPTQLGYDSDDPRAAGEVGRTGVAIDSIADMELLFDGIPLDEVSTSMTINAPASLLLLLLYELVAEEQGVAGARAARHGPERHPQGVRRARELHLPAAAVDAADDRPVRLLRRAAAELEHDLDLRVPHPRGRLDRGAGDRVHARERDRLLRRRRSTRGSRRTSSASGSRSSSTRTTTSSRRWRSSARRGGCGREILRERFGATNPKALALRFHAQTGGSTLTAQQPENNVVRVAIQALSAVCGGAQSLHTNSFDEALALPTEHAARIALRTQQILAHEAGGDRHGRPARRRVLRRGAHRRARGARARADRPGRGARRRGRRDRAGLRPGRDRGGRLPLHAAGRVGRARDRRRQPLRGGRGASEIELHRLDPETERRQLERTARVRAERNAGEAAAALAEVRRVAGGDENLLPPMREALRARCTVGEICDVLREEWGTYDAQRGVASRPVRILLVSQMYPGPDDPDLGVFVAQLERALARARARVRARRVDPRGGGKRRYASGSLADARARGPALPTRRRLRALPRPGRPRSPRSPSRAPLVVTAHGQDVAQRRRVARRRRRRRALRRRAARRR